LVGVELVLLEVPLLFFFAFFFFFLVLVPAELPASALSLALLPELLPVPEVLPLPVLPEVVPVPAWAKTPAEASAALARTRRPVFQILMCSSAIRGGIAARSGR
jgi:hypothetical protein